MRGAEVVDGIGEAEVGAGGIVAVGGAGRWERVGAGVDGAGGWRGGDLRERILAEGECGSGE